MSNANDTDHQSHASGGNNAGGAGDTSAAVGPKPKRSPLVPPNNNLSEDELVVKSFMDQIQYNIDHHILHAPKGKERELLQGAIFYPGLYIGVAVGLVQFAVLRRAPVYVMNRIQQKQGQKATNSFKESNFVKPFSILFDGVLSAAMAGTVWILASDKKKMYDTASDIPLIEGRSDISDALCSDFIEKYQSIRPQFWTEYRDDSLTAITQFVNNCKRRQAYERRLRRDAGLGATDPVSIPSGGVPRDYVDDEEGEEDWASLEDFEEDAIGGDRGSGGVGGSGEAFWTSGSGGGMGDGGSSWGR